MFLLFLAFLLGWYCSGCIREHFAKKHPKLEELKYTIQPIFSKDEIYSGKLESLNDRDLMNEIQLFMSNKSYTINKKKIHLCLLDANGEVYDNNTLIYVLLHEIAHCVNDTIGHDESFQETFDEILLIAKNKNIYDPSIPLAKNYCGYNT